MSWRWCSQWSWKCWSQHGQRVIQWHRCHCHIYQRTSIQRSGHIWQNCKQRTDCAFVSELADKPSIKRQIFRPALKEVEKFKMNCQQKMTSDQNDADRALKLIEEYFVRKWMRYTKDANFQHETGKSQRLLKFIQTAFPEITTICNWLKIIRDCTPHNLKYMHIRTLKTLWGRWLSQLLSLFCYQKRK